MFVKHLDSLGGFFVNVCCFLYIHLVFICDNLFLFLFSVPYYTCYFLLKK